MRLLYDSNMSSRKFYLRFASLVNAVNKDAGVDLDSIAMRLLEAITEAHAAGAPLKVTSALELDLASAATLHKKIDSLKSQGFVQIEHPEDTKRTKFLVPTDQALDHLDALGKALLKAARK
jgi:DNA-binding MarR family transcriptional regulator